MSEGNRRADIALVGLAIAIVAAIIVWSIAALAYQHGRHAQGDEQAASHQTGDGEQQWKAFCLPVPITGASACVLQPPDSDAETERSKRDLRAQEEMADWALLMFFATFTGVAVTIIGLIYIVRAYRLNAAATDHARIAANAAVAQATAAEKTFAVSSRPYVLPIPEVEFADRQEVRLGVELVQMRYSVTLANYGNGLARIISLKVSHSFGLEPTFEYHPDAEALWFGKQQVILEGKSRLQSARLATGVEFTRDEYFQLTDATRPALIFGELLYRDAMLQTVYRRVFCYGPTIIIGKIHRYEHLAEWGGAKYNREEEVKDPA